MPTGDVVRAWAWGGPALLFGQAAIRLGARGVATIRGGLAAPEWAALAVLTGLLVYVEGVRALQRRYVPGVVRRAGEAPTEASLLLRALAPLYAMSLVGAPAATLARAWAGVAAVVVAVLVVSRFPDPWRGVTDFAVAAALAWGLGALLVEALRAPRGSERASPSPPRARSPRRPPWSPG